MTKPLIDTTKEVAPDVSKAWIHTFSGLKFYHLNPKPEMINIEDIAHSLALLCRWTGHTRHHYSVAQHSYYCSKITKPEFALAALLHDASEAYLNDINRPLKHFTGVGPAYLKIEEKVEKVIFKKFDLSFPLPPEVKQADNQMLYTEKKELIKGEDWTYHWGHDGSLAEIKIERWTPRHAEKMFLKRFKELTNKET